MEYIIYCDESSDQGERYTDFYGGCIVDCKYIDDISNALNKKKIELNLCNEIKWTRVTGNYLEKYIQVIDLFFTFVKDGKIRVRIMFRKKENGRNYVDCSDDKYFKLYYQFIKHSFGLKYIPLNNPTYIKLMLDELPDKVEKCKRFKNYIINMPNTRFFNDSGLIIRPEDVVEIDSKNHVIQQCLDIVLGAMFFRLNNLHKVIPDGMFRRGKRTIAKEKLYKHILGNIREVMPNFNIGISTGSRGYEYAHWSSPYEHWLFTSYEMMSIEDSSEL